VFITALFTIAKTWKNGVGGTKAAPRAKPLGPARPEAPARNWQIISAGWVWDAGGAFGKREQAEEKHSFQAQKHHEHEISHHTKEAECLERGTERHRRPTKNLKHRDAVTKGTRFSVEGLLIIAHFCVDIVLV
uniref:Uncharacterized protein n=1 Tax=Capra hircus TaxID=9925 RepID=A0A8C2RF65_CAPHI